jgi:DNA-binding XRE family transcriptional regulator
MARNYKNVIAPVITEPGSDLARFEEASQEYFQALYEEDFGLGEKVARRRAELSLTQIELARRTGVRQALISNIECETANPTLETLKKIFKELNLQLSAEPYKQASMDITGRGLGKQ